MPDCVVCQEKRGAPVESMQSDHWLAFSTLELKKLKPLAADQLQTTNFFVS